jgi:hypothetical protein
MAVGANVTASAVNAHAAFRTRTRLRLAETISGKNWAANTLQCGSRAERTFPGNSGPDRPEKCGRDPRACDAQTHRASRCHTCRREPRQRQWRPWRERPLRTDAGPHPACAAGSLTPWFPIPAATTAPEVGGKERRPITECARAPARTSCAGIGYNGPSKHWRSGGLRARGRARVQAGDDLNFRGRPRGRPQPYAFRRRQPGERDGGTGVKARRSRRARDHVPGRRQWCSSRQSRSCSPGPPTTVGTGLGTWAR